MQNFSYKNNFHLHENEILGGTHFHITGFARRLVLAQTQKPTQKWHIRLRARDFYEMTSQRGDVFACIVVVFLFCFARFYVIYEPHVLVYGVTLSILSDFLSGKCNLDIFLVSGRRASWPYLQFSL